MSTETHRILIVDDELLIRTLAKRALVKTGQSVDVAEHGKEALEKFRKQPYDLVITDLKMPKMDGHLFACELLKMRKPPFIIVVTACLDPRMERDLMKRGVSAFFVKPAKFAQVTTKARTLLGIEEPEPAAK